MSNSLHVITDSTNMSTTWETYELPGVTGGGWEYDNAAMTYDDLVDADTGQTLYYDGEGTSQTWTTQTKS